MEYGDLLGRQRGPRGFILNGGTIEVVIAERRASEDHSWSHGISGQRPTLHLHVEDLGARFSELRATVHVVVHLEATH